MFFVAFPARVGNSLVPMKVDTERRGTRGEIRRTLWEYNPGIQFAFDRSLSVLAGQIQRNKKRRTLADFRY
jgi:hypothetical protein